MTTRRTLATTSRTRWRLCLFHAQTPPSSRADSWPTATPVIYSGATPQFTVTNIATGQWELRIPGYTPTNGVLITSAEGGLSYNQDNIVTYQANTNGDGWIIESRDLPACGLQTPTGEPVASFVFIPAPPPGLTLSQTNLVTTETGGTATFTVALKTQPAANVVVAIASGDTSEGTVSPASLTFTTNDWNVAQTVVVTAVDDLVNDDDISYHVTCTASSSDPIYAAVPPVTVSVTNLDNEEGLTLPSGVLFYGVGMPAVGLDGRAIVVDPETPNYSTGSLTVTLTANGTADDRLEIRHTGTGAGQIGVSGSTVTYGGTVVGTFTGGQGTTPLVVTFTSAMNRAAAEALVRSVTFRNVSSQPSLNPRTVSVVLVDGNYLASSAGKSISIGQLRVSDFQEGADGGYGAYTGAANLELYQVNPNTPYPTGHSATGLWVDYPDNANACHLLLRFDNIIGNGLGQIPSNAIVVSAELMLYAANAGDGSPLYRMLRSWNAATDTWNTLGAGVQTNNVEARSTFDSQIGSYDGAGTGARRDLGRRDARCPGLGQRPDQLWLGDARLAQLYRRHRLPPLPGAKHRGPATPPGEMAPGGNRPGQLPPGGQWLYQCLRHASPGECAGGRCVGSREHVYRRGGNEHERPGAHSLALRQHRWHPHQPDTAGRPRRGRHARSGQRRWQRPGRRRECARVAPALAGHQLHLELLDRGHSGGRRGSRRHSHGDTRQRQPDTQCPGWVPLAGRHRRCSGLGERDPHQLRLGGPALAGRHRRLGHRHLRIHRGAEPAAAPRVLLAWSPACRPRSY